MLVQNKIEQYLKEIQELEKFFREAQNKEILPLSFFSSSIDILYRLRAGIYEIEATQLQAMQDHYHLNKFDSEWRDLKEPKELKELKEPKEPKEPKVSLETKLIDKIEEMGRIDYVEETEDLEEEVEDFEDELDEPEEEFDESEEEFDEFEDELDEPEEEFDEETEELKTIEDKITPITNILADTIGRKIQADFGKSLRLNDRFMFQRDLFQRNTDEMNRAFAQLNTFQTLNEALEFLNKNYNIPWNTDSGNALKELLENRFA